MASKCGAMCQRYSPDLEMIKSFLLSGVSYLWRTMKGNTVFLSFLILIPKFRAKKSRVYLIFRQNLGIGCVAIKS